jgi:diguanylate cyclase (GGDEF)-like protein
MSGLDPMVSQSAPVGGWRAALGGGTAIALTLILLLVGVLVGSQVSNWAVSQSQQASQLSDAYEQAATAVAAEESLERKYRLQPGPEPLAGHDSAEQAVVAAMEAVRKLGGPADRTLARKVLTEHTAYVAGAEALFKAVDRGSPTSVVNAIDTDQVDPTFGVMQQQIYGAAASHTAHADHQIQVAKNTGRVVLWSNVATLLAGIALIVGFAASQARARRRLAQQSDLNRHQALHDSLTGLPNRALFQDRTAQALRAAGRSGTQVAVMLLDIDRFKDVNDTLGHHYGDMLLRQIAERFTATMRAGDSVARLGGDEFVVLLTDTTPADAVVAAQRLTDVLHEPFTVKDITLDVEASIGIAMARPDADVEVVLRHADVAMYEAKGQHLPFVVYELCRDDNTVDRLALLGDLRRSIHNGELVLHYQPKVNTRTGELHSVEALVRWQHPTRGMLAPDQFIPIAETTAVIHPLTAEVLRQALAQTRRWLDRGWSVPVAVNVSAGSLHDLTFPTEVQRQLDTANVPANMLSLELTESAIMTDPGRALTVLEALNGMGVSLSIDDFGTGYSSMSYLKALPVRELKIDRSFVKGMTTDESDGVLVQSAVDLGHNLGLHVVAEGVEDDATQQALNAMGCDLVQGFHIRRPVAAAELNVWLAERIPKTIRTA